MEQPTPTKTLPRPRKIKLGNLPMDLPPEDVEEISPGVFEVPDEDEGSRIIEEIAPKIPTPKLSEQIQSTTERLRERAQRFRKPNLGKPGIKRPRSSVEGLISTVWNLAARVVQPLAYPVSNVLAMQSPVAGAILEDAVKNTAIDGILQPVARLFKGGDTAFALLAPPILVGVACARPDTQPIVEPLLREALRSWLNVAGPKLIEKAKEEAKFQEEYGATIDGMIQAIFTPPPGFEPATDDTAEHNGHKQTVAA